MEISNKTLAILLVGAIVVSLAGSIITLNKFNQAVTGFATTGVANLTISSTSSITFAVAAMEFGSGSVNTAGAYTNCTMVMNGTNTAIVKIGCLGFNGSGVVGAVNNSFVIENDGNKFLSVTLNFTKSNDTLIGGTNPRFFYTVYQNETNSCLNSTGVQIVNTSLTGWTNVLAGNVTGICDNLSYATANDSLGIGINLSVPYDSFTGTLNNTLIITGTALP